jgi:hypothetical protein
MVMHGIPTVAILMGTVLQVPPVVVQTIGVDLGLTALWIQAMA